MLAMSETEFPTTIELVDSEAVTVGVAFVTVRVSDPHALATRLLFASPLYVACQLNVPVALKIIPTGPALVLMSASVTLEIGIPAQTVPE